MNTNTANSLTALFVKKAKRPRKYGNGNGLYLHVKISGVKHWFQSLMIQAKRRDLCLGSAELVSLENARKLARSNRQTGRQGGDPLAERQKQQGELCSTAISGYMG